MEANVQEEADREDEYDRLREGLVWDEMDRFARSIHSAQAHVDGTSKLTHLYAVSELAGRYADRYYAEEDLFEQRYACIVCRAAGLLHETMVSGRDFEELVDRADEAVARLVAELTPDVRFPRAKRFHMMANQLGLASPPAQLIALADLQHQAAGWARLLSRTEVDLHAARRGIDETRLLAESLSKLRYHDVTADAVVALIGNLKGLQKACRRKD